MEPNHPKRFDRIVAILIQLQSKPVVKAQELAERFQVSLRTIYRDLRSLETAGVPLYGEAGTGYSLMEGYRLPPVMFTREEAGSFVAAEKLMEQFSDKNVETHFKSALFKVKSVLRNSEKNWVAALGEKISIYSPQNNFNEKVPHALELFFESLTEKKQVVLTYQSVKAETTVNRNIEAVGIFHENQHWYILGYCHLRKDYRQFRIDRIHDLKRSKLGFTRTHGTVEEHRKKNSPKAMLNIRIRVDKKVVEHLKYDRHYYGFVSETEENGHVQMHFKVPENDPGFPRWFLMFGDYAQILEPEALKEQVKKILSDAAKNLEA